MATLNPVAFKRLSQFLKGLYWLVRIVVPLAAVVGVIFLIFDTISIAMKLFFITQVIVSYYFIQKLLSIVDEEMLTKE